MGWIKFTNPNLKWYEALWALLPIGVMTVGGVIGGACGGAACAINMALMQGQRRPVQKYALTGLVSLGSIGAYYVIAKGLIVSLGVGGMSAEQADRELQKSPVFAAVQKAEPDTYTKIRAALVDGTAHGKSQADIGRTINGYLVGVMAKYLPIASDESIVEMTRVVTLEVDQIGAKSADACFGFLYHPGSPAKVDLTQFVTPEVLAADKAAMTAILESGMTSPQRVPAKQEINPAFNRLGQQLITSFGQADVAALANPATMDHGRYCTITGSLYKQVLSMPRADAVPLLRFLYGHGAA